MKNIQKESLDSQIYKFKTIIKQSIQSNKNQPTNKSKRFIIGICGIPGSGKSTISDKLCQKLSNSIVLPMDGFHIERKYLTQQGIIRRGAAFTFDLKKFQSKIIQIRNANMQQTIKYPNFDHKQKDPVQNAIQINPYHEILIIQGIYVFDKNLNINSNSQISNQIWDLKIWVNSQLQQSIERVAKRHLASGIEPTYQLAYQRASSNDRANAIYIRQNCYNQAAFINLADWKQGDKQIIIDNTLSW